MDVEKIVSAGSPSQLGHGFNERHTLDVADGATKLYNAYIWLLVRVIDWDLGYPLDPVLNRIGDVWHNLDGPSKIVALSLAIDDVLVNLASGNVVLSSQSDVQIALVVPKIEIDFSTVIKNENLAMPSTN